MRCSSAAQLDQGVLRNKNTMEELQMLRQEIRGKEEQITEIRADANKLQKVPPCAGLLDCDGRCVVERGHAEEAARRRGDPHRD